jgi:class I fructose-bisphosphate aldolase
VLFSGGPVRNDRALLDEIEEIHLGGAHGSIVGRNAFQRPYRDALTLLQNIIDIHLDGGA